MQIRYESKETIEAEYMSREAVVAWLEKNGWSRISTGVNTDYWVIYQFDEYPSYKVCVPNVEGTYADYLKDESLTRTQEQTLRDLQWWLNKPAKAIWQEMLDLEVNDVK